VVVEVRGLGKWWQQQQQRDVMNGCGGKRLTFSLSPRVPIASTWPPGEGCVCVGHFLLRSHQSQVSQSKHQYMYFTPTSPGVRKFIITRFAQLDKVVWGGCDTLIIEHKGCNRTQGLEIVNEK